MARFADPRVDERNRLRVVDHGEVRVELQTLAVQLAVREKGLEILRPRFIRAAVQRVVERLGDRKEVVPARDDVPPRNQPQFLNQRDQPAENLGDAATHGGRIDHLHGPALELSREGSQVVDFFGTQQRNVIVEIDKMSGERFSHAASSRSMSARSWPLAPSSVCVEMSI